MHDSSTVESLVYILSLNQSEGELAKHKLSDQKVGHENGDAAYHNALGAGTTNIEGSAMDIVAKE